MAKRLTKLMVDEVSAVDKGANNKRFLILKAGGDLRLEKDEGDGMYYVLGPQGGKRSKGYKKKGEAAEELKRLIGDVGKRAAEEEDGGGLKDWVREAFKKVAGGGTKDGGQDMKPDEIKKAIQEGLTEGMAPFEARLAALEAGKVEKAEGDGAEEGEGEEEPVEKVKEDDGDELTMEQFQEVVKGAVKDAMAPVEKRIEKLESVKGVRKSQDPETASGGGSMWSGIL